MNREIEFRGFLKGYNNNKCFEISVLALKECGWNCDKGIGVSIPYQPRIKIMQYTGLKDKNGKKIFEGDILKQQRYQKNKPYGNSYNIVSWRKVKNGIGFNVSKTENWEVIGNIYENDLESKGEQV